MAAVTFVGAAWSLLRIRAQGGLVHAWGVRDSMIPLRRGRASARRRLGGWLCGFVVGWWVEVVAEVVGLVAVVLVGVAAEVLVGVEPAGWSGPGLSVDHLD